VRLREPNPQRQINGEFAMFPYIDPESINAMFPLTADEPALDISQEALQIPAEYKGQVHIVPGRHVAFWTPSRIVTTVATILMICLIIYLIVILAGTAVSFSSKYRWEAILGSRLLVSVILSLSLL
jgi:hypothetical protein